jgi:hypothetical protein
LPATRPRLREPVFIVSAPRSGSTLLFETLSVTPQLWTVAGEAHWLVESIPELRPGAPGVDSNRLTAAQCSDAIARRIEDELIEQLRDPEGRALPAGHYGVRVLEKTPKNALRIPFFARLFPDARFVVPLIPVVAPVVAAGFAASGRPTIGAIARPLAAVSLALAAFVMVYVYLPFLLRMRRA